MSLKYEPSSEPLRISARFQATVSASSLLLSSLELSDTKVYEPQIRWGWKWLTVAEAAINDGLSPGSNRPLAS